MYVTHGYPIFSKGELLSMKRDSYIANISTFPMSLDLDGILEELPQVKFALYPNQLTQIPKISYTR